MQLKGNQLLHTFQYAFKINALHYLQFNGDNKKNVWFKNDFAVRC